jgi:hypothetical protein
VDSSANAPGSGRGVTGRFVSNLSILLAAATLVALALGLRPGPAGWVGFGVSCLVAIVTLAVLPLRGRGHGQRALDVLLLLVAAWTIVSCRSFDGETLRWLAVSSGLAFGTLAVAGLVAHEVRLEEALAAQRSDDGRVTALPERPPIGVVG